MTRSQIIRAIRARISYNPQKSNFLTSLFKKGGSPLTFEDIICSYIDAINELKTYSPYMKRFCFMRAMGYSDYEIKTGLSTSKKKFKKVSPKKVDFGVVVYSRVNNLDDKAVKEIIDKYDDDIRKTCGVFRKKYAAINWGEYYQESIKKLIELFGVPLSNLNKLSNRAYVMTVIRNHLLDLVNSEYKEHENTASLDKILEGIMDNEETEE